MKNDEDTEDMAWEPSEDESRKTNKGKNCMLSANNSDAPQPSSAPTRTSRNHAIELVPSILHPPTRSQCV